MSGYWDDEWERRLSGEYPSMNLEKMAKLIYELTIRPELAPLNKLEIGCGPCIHARHLANIYSGWRDKYTGIDMSKTAVDHARAAKINAVHGDFYTYSFHNKFNCFLFLDVLEHLFDHEKVSARVKELADWDGGVTVFGNVPLFVSREALDSGVEHQVTMPGMRKLCEDIGLAYFDFEIYGANGLPFLRFQAA